MRYAALLLLPLALAGCATLSPEARVRAKLEAAGLSPRLSACMAHRMVEKLSWGQLRELSGLGKRDLGAISIEELLYRVRALDDPRIVKVVSKAALVCSIGG